VATRNAADFERRGIRVVNPWNDQNSETLTWPVLITVAILVAGLVRLLVFIFLEVPLLAVVQVSRMISFTFVHALLVSFVLRIIRTVVLEKWSPGGLRRARRDPNACYYC
jgi:hypothetical protein